MDYILNNHKIDGIECYYTTFSKEQHNTIFNLCREKQLYISGGSDFHGKLKPDVKIGVGFGNLEIPTSIVNDWIAKVKLL